MSESGPKGGGFGLADLVALRMELGEDRFQQLARDLQWDKVPSTAGMALDMAGMGTTQSTGERALPLPTPVSATPAGQPQELPFWRMVSVEYFPGFSRDTKAQPYNPAKDQPPLCWRSVLDGPELGPWSELWPRLFQALAVEQSRARVHVPQLVQSLARGESVQRFPQRVGPRWPERLLVIVDASSHLAPVHADRLRVIRDLGHVLAAGAIEEVPVEGDLTQRRKHILSCVRQGDHQAVLVLGDLACALGRGGARERRAWRDLAAQLQNLGALRLAALIPLPRYRWTGGQGQQQGLLKAWGAMPWEPELEVRRQCSGHEDPAGFLLQLVACASRVEPSLLRAVRQLLPRSQADVGTEIDAWQHSLLTYSCTAGCVIGNPALRDSAFALADLSEPVRERLCSTLKHNHRHLAPELWHTTVLLLHAVDGPLVRKYLARDLDLAGKWADSTAMDLDNSTLRPHLDDMAGYLLRLELRGEGIATDEPALSTVLGVLHGKPIDTGDEPAPPGEPWDLHQGPRGLQMTPQGSSTEMPDRPRPSFLGHIDSEDAQFRLTRWGKPALLWDARSREPLSELSPGALEIRTDRLKALLQPVVLGDLSWARSLGRDRHGLWAEFEVADVSHRMRWIPPGRFVMGSPGDEAGRWDDEGPQHQVTILRGFWLGEVPCTQDLWKAVMPENPSRFQSDRRPVENVSWKDVQGFLGKLNKLDQDLGLSLPHEIHWEYACRAGTSEATYAGDTKILGEHNAPVLHEIAWYGGNSGVGYDLPEAVDSSGWPDKQFDHSRAGSRVVGTKGPNGWGLLDTLGNVWEWCSNRLEPYAGEDVIFDPTGDEVLADAGEDGRVVRGGSWSDQAQVVRAAFRCRFSPVSSDEYLGFRLFRGQGAPARNRAAEPPTGGRAEPARDAPAEKRPEGPSR